MKFTTSITTINTQKKCHISQRSTFTKQLRKNYTIITDYIHVQTIHIALTQHKYTTYFSPNKV